MPSYTINTYFNRPGNGCHVHPVEDRVLSQREAARLQSFPDKPYKFGAQTAYQALMRGLLSPEEYLFGLEKG